MTERRRTFVPTLLVGLAGAVLGAVAGNQPWAEAGAVEGVGGDVADAAAAVSRATAPLATALALVVLASWGVLLVARGRFRRVVTWLLALASVGQLAAVIAAFLAAPDAVRDIYAPYGLPGVEVSRTLWCWAAVLGSVAALGAAAVAVRQVSHWPQMGSRYDAPGGGTDQQRPGGEPGNLDLWKAMDEGHDPTA